MNFSKKIRNRIWLVADRIRARIGEKRFLDSMNQDWIKSYEEVHDHWDKPETSVHRQATEAVLKAMSEYIGEELYLGKDDNVLDIGCGDGQIDFFLKDKCGHMSGLDFSETKIEEAKERNRDVTYFVASFLDDYKEKCININKVFSYSVMQYCKPEDAITFVKHSVEALGENGGVVVHMDIPDKDKIEVYYSLMYGVPTATVSRMRNDITYIYLDGSYWHDMKKIKKDCESLLKDFWGEAEEWHVAIESADCYYRSNLRIERRGLKKG